jgi:predicted dehydrogenase
MVRVGVIGYGYWGPNLVRNFNDIPGSQVVAVSDLREDRLANLRSRYPAIKATNNAMEIFADSTIDAVVIATPVSTHFSLAMQALHAGKHVLVEKPLTTTSEQCERLIEEAERCRRVLMVDHTFVYSGAVRKIKELIEQGRLGELYYYDSVRVNLGLFQHDVSVIWDLAVHDLAIMDYLLGTRPSAISAVGMAHVPGQPKDIAYVNCFFDSHLIAHFHVNWLAPVKVRRTLIGGGREMVVYDDLQPSESVKVYNKGITLNNGHGAEGMYQVLLGYRTGDMWAPQVDGTEALRVEALHFLDCITTGAQPTTGGPAGLRVVKILEAATLSMTQRGRPVELSWEREYA